MPQIAHLFFKTAIIFFIVGIAMGLQMSISGVHDVIGAHAHTNLLGWVSMAIFGIYYALNPQKAESRSARIHYAGYTLGVAIMVPSLYLLLKGYAGAEPFVAVSSLLVAAAVVLFAFILFAGERQTTARPMQPPMRPMAH